MKSVIYLDNAATTRVRPEVIEAMLPFYTGNFANPSSTYKVAQENRACIEECRKSIAATIKADAKEIYFTAGGSEADNWALKSAAEAYAMSDKPPLCNNKNTVFDNYGYTGRKCLKGHIITTNIEHHAILHTALYLEKMGCDVTYLNVDERGIVRLKDLKKAIRPDTFLISVMYANNEIGTIEPVKEIGEIALENNILFHTDAVQAYGHIPIDVNECNIDMLSASGHKLNGPKGTGFLYIREGVELGSFIHGGAQEMGKRAGTENVPGIVGLSKACGLAEVSMKERTIKELSLRNHLIDRILSEIPYARLNGDAKRRLPNNVNISFQFVEGEALLVMLDMEGICASAGSACTSGLSTPSHVLTAIGLPEEIARGSLRMTISEDNTFEELDHVVDVLKDKVFKLRSVSPEYEDYRRRI